MDGWGGLIELVLVFGLVLGFAVYELMSVRRYKTRKSDETAERPERTVEASDNAYRRNDD